MGNGSEWEWASVATSADGAKRIAVPDSDAIYLSQSVFPPVLGIINSSADNILSWTVPTMHYVLQQNPNPAILNWADVPVAPLLNYSNMQCQAALAVTNGAMFYRLISR